MTSPAYAVHSSHARWAGSAYPWSAPSMRAELFRKVAHERGTAVLVVTHDHRALDVFDHRDEREDGRLRPQR